MPPPRTLPPLPEGLPFPDGLWSGTLDRDPRAGRRGRKPQPARRGRKPQPARRERTRRWSYTAAGGEEGAVGAAVVDLGFASTAFAWALIDGQVLTWDARGVPGLSARMGSHAVSAARFRARRAHVHIDEGGGLDVDVPVRGGRLRAALELLPDLPAVCVTPTPGGGWNATQKVAGERACVRITAPGVQITSTGAAWRDWTLGAQDRETTWRWAAGAGQAVDGRRVGLNASTGMNGAGAGENVAWWDGVPHALDVGVLGATQGDPAGAWEVAGPGWAVHLEPAGARAATENLLVVRSAYVQPIGRFVGTLPDPSGRPVQVALVGVTEDHRARW